jgi:hypothetical protein
MPLDDHPASSVREDHPEHSICEILYRDRVIGLGFAIDQGHVATCAHVVNSALGRKDKRDPARPGNAEMICLRFAIGSADGDGGCRKASIVGWLPVGARTFDADDIAVLRLDEPAPADVRALRPARYRPLMPVQMWGPQPGRPDGGHVKGEVRGKVRSGRFQLGVEGGQFRVRPGFSGGPVWEPGTGKAVGVLSACGAEDDATDAYLLEADRVAAVWPGWSEHTLRPAPEGAHPGLRTRSLVLLAIGLAAIVYALGMVILRPDWGLSAPRPPHPTSRSTASASRAPASRSPRPDRAKTSPPVPVLTSSRPAPIPNPSPTRGKASSPSPAVSSFRPADPYFIYDPLGVEGSEVRTGFFGCYGWLDNYGSGDLSGAIYAASGYCAGEVSRSGGPTVHLTASSGAGERVSALSDSGHTMQVCVWSQNDQADEQCSPWFEMDGDIPVQN